MWWKKKTDDPLEWTVSEAGFDTEPEIVEDSPPPEAPAAPVVREARPFQFPWRRVAWLAAPALLILAGVWAWSRWNQWQTRREVEQALIGEVAAPPSPLGFLTWDESQPLSVATTTQLDVDTLRAEAVHAFVAPDGQRYTFAVPRFFSRAGESWLPSDPPDTFPGEIRQHTGELLTLRYYTADAELVERYLIPYLEATLERVCARWECARPATLSLTGILVSTRITRSLEREPDFDLEPSEPLLFWLLAADNAQVLGEQIGAVAAPHAVGYPVDAASRELWLRTLALRAFSQLALSETFGERPNDASANPFFQAFVALEAVNHGLERPSIREYGLGNDTSPLVLPVSVFDSGQYLGQAEQTTQRRELLALLNHFARQWPEAEPFDFSQVAFFVGAGPGPASWLVRQSQRDGQPLSEWVNDWREVLGQPPSQVTLPVGDLMLNCFYGPQVYGADGLKPLLPLSELPIPAYSFVGWSPTGRYVPLGLGFQASVLDTQTGLFRLPPDDANTFFALPMAWASDSVLAYLAVEAAALRSGSPNPEAFQLRFFDLTEPARNLSPLNSLGAPFGFGQSTYLPSPDRQWAALLSTGTSETDSRVTLDLLPALGGQRQLLTRDGQPPAWSPDSRELAFMDWGASTESSVLRVYTVSTGQTRVVWDSRSWETAALRTQLAWSPDGRWIALAAQPSDSNSLRWFGLIAPDGSEVIRLDTPPGSAATDNSQGFQSLSSGVINGMAFSNDGRYLALSGALAEPQLLIYDLTRGRVARTLPGGAWPQLQWSPDDRQLLLAGNGVALLSEPLNARSQIEQLSDGESCFAGWWKPR